MHTGKVQIHKAFYILGIAVIVVVGLFYYIYHKKTNEFAQAAQQNEQTQQPQNRAQNALMGDYGNNSRQRTLSMEDYLKSHQPRLKGFPHTASRYDDITKPVTAPYPAACISMQNHGCRCFTQQGTRISMDEDTCENIVKEGYFVDWDKEPQRNNDRGMI